MDKAWDSWLFTMALPLAPWFGASHRILLDLSFPKCQMRIIILQHTYLTGELWDLLNIRVLTSLDKKCYVMLKYLVLIKLITLKLALPSWQFHQLKELKKILKVNTNNGSVASVKICSFSIFEWKHILLHRLRNYLIHKFSKQRY